MVTEACREPNSALNFSDISRLLLNTAGHTAPHPLKHKHSPDSQRPDNQSSPCNPQR